MPNNDTAIEPPENHNEPIHRKTVDLSDTPFGKDTQPQTHHMPEEVVSPEEKGDPATCPSPYNDFRSGTSWRIFRIMAEFIEGFEFLADLKKEVTIMGSARVEPGTPLYEEARKLGQLLGKEGYTIITGGGPGIMEAANRGAYETDADSVGINIQLPKEQRINPFVKRGKGFYYFFTRKVILTASAQAYCFFPGGFGTLDELFELLTLIQTKKMCNIPIILIGQDYWGSMLDWLNKNILENDYIDNKDLAIFKIVNTAEEAFDVVKTSTDRPFF